MNILVTSLYKDASGGGSGSYTATLMKALRKLGHNVTYSDAPGTEQQTEYDMVISSHNRQLVQIESWNIPIVHICHGTVPTDERPVAGASAYVAITPEVSRYLDSLGYSNTIIPQPVEIPEDISQTTANDILYIINSASRCLVWNLGDISISKKDIPIEEQIKTAKIVITIGRGALEAMAWGKPVILADNRWYMGAKGDGYVTPANFDQLEQTNFSGRCFNIDATQTWMEGELKKYNPVDGLKLRELVAKKYDSLKVAQQFIDLAMSVKDKQHVQRKVRVRGITRVRNEEAIIKDTLDHLGTICDDIYVYDDASTDGTVTICENHPKVKKVVKGTSWDSDRERAEYENRQTLFNSASESLSDDDWLVYIDADERLHFNQAIFQFPDVDAIIMKLFDFYITEEDKDLPYPGRQYIGPEYRPILMAFRKRAALGYSMPDQRECSLKLGTRIVHDGSVAHYGKAISIDQWDRTVDYYVNHFPKYAKKWEQRRGKAIHDKSDFGADLIKWEERFKKGYPLDR